MRKAKNVLWTAAFLATALLPMCLRAEEVSPPASQVASLTASPTRLDWLPLVDYGHLVLTVAGPDSLTLQQEFQAGQSPSLSLFDSEGNRLPDGSYTWELRVIPQRRAGGREKSTGPGNLPRPLVQSGHFSIRNGGFGVAGVPAGSGPDSPKPPIRNVTDKLLTTDNLTVKGNACIGPECVIDSNGTNTDATFSVLKLKGPNLGILFDDVEVPETSGVFRNWALGANPDDADQFSLMDIDAGALPLSVAGGAPSNSLYVRSNGAVGLGTSTPGQRLHLFENADANTMVLIENPHNGSNAGAHLRLKTDTASVNVSMHGGGRTISRFGQTLGSWSEILQVSGQGLIVGTLAEKPLILGTNSTNRIHIAPSGNIGIGTTTPTQPIQHSSGASLTAGGVWQSASSRSAKHDIRELDAADARAALAGLAAVRFRYNAEPNEESLGFIAEDVPELVATSDHKSLSPMDIVAVLTKMVQEQERTIEELRARIEQIEGCQP